MGIPISLLTPSVRNPSYTTLPPHTNTKERERKNKTCSIRNVITSFLLTSTVTLNVDSFTCCIQQVPPHIPTQKEEDRAGGEGRRRVGEKRGRGGQVRAGERREENITCTIKNVITSFLFISTVTS